MDQQQIYARLGQWYSGLNESGAPFFGAMVRTAAV